MVVSDVGCAPGADALAALAARLAERVTNAPARPPPPPNRNEEDDLAALIHGIRIGAPGNVQPPAPLPQHTHTPLHGPIPAPHLHQPAPPPPTPPTYVPVPEPDANATTARFEAAFAATTPTMNAQRAPLPPPPPHPTPAFVHLPWQPPPPPPAHLMHRPPGHYFTPPAFALHHPPPPPMPIHPHVPARTHGVPGPSTQPAAAQPQQGDALYDEVLALLNHAGERNTNDAEALGLLANAQENWDDEFTSMEASALRERRYPQTGTPDGVDDPENAPGFDTYASDLVAAGMLDPATQAYDFEQRNAATHMAAAEALAEGIRLREQGLLFRATLAFEAALNRPANDAHPPLPPQDQMHAWYLLGVTLAESDDDPRAIQALAQVRSPADDAAPSMLVVDESRGSEQHMQPLQLEAAAALALAVSYVNELDSNHAVQQLWRWLALRARLRGMAEPQRPRTEDGTDRALAQVIQALGDTVRTHPQDADARLALGVAQNAERDYAQAAAAIRSALAIRDTDARLWNRLGATLANGGRADEALRAYRRAVDLFPRYTRAWVNVGTAYVNNGDAARAARYYVRALVLAADDAARDDGAMQHVWAYLRSALVTLGRDDLLALCASGDLDALRRHLRA